MRKKSKGQKKYFQVANTLILIKKDGKYTKWYDLQEDNGSRPMFAKSMLGMAKL
jgi:hypothetical protein